MTWQLVFHVYDLDLDNLPTSRTCRVTEKVAKGRAQPLMKEGAVVLRSPGAPQMGPPPASGQQLASSTLQQSRTNRSSEEPVPAQPQQSAAGQQQLQQTPGSRPACALLEAALVPTSSELSERDLQPQSRNVPVPLATSTTASPPQTAPLTLDTSTLSSSLSSHLAPLSSSLSSPSAASSQTFALSDSAGRVPSFKMKGALFIRVGLIQMVTVSFTNPHSILVFNLTVQFNYN